MTEKTKPAVRPGKKTLHILRMFATGLALVLLTALLYLLLFGLPAPAVRAVTASARRAGLPLRVESIRYSPLHGWKLDQVRLYSPSPDDLSPLLDIPRLHARIRPVHVLNPARRGLAVSLSAPELSVSLGRPWNAVLPADHPFRTARKLSAGITLDPDGLDVRHAGVFWGPVEINASGTFKPGKGGTPSAWNPDAIRQAASVAQTIAALEWTEPPQLDLQFQSSPENVLIQGALRAGGWIFEGRTYDRIRAGFEWRDRILQNAQLEIAQPDGSRLNLSGMFDFNTRTAALSAENTLTAEDLTALLPARLRTAPHLRNLTAFGPADFEIHCGPAPADELFRTLRADVRQAGLRRDGLVIAPLALHFTRDGDRMEVSRLETEVNGGPLEGTIRHDAASGEWNASIQSRCDPAPLLAMTDLQAVQQFVQRFEFRDRLPEADLEMHRADSASPLKITGTLTAEEFTCAGIPMDRLETRLAYTNRVLDLSPLRISSGERRFSGRVQVDFPGKTAYVDAVSSFDPRDVARVLLPGRPTVLERFRFDGPVYATVRGHVDYGEGTGQSFSGTLHAERAGMGPLRLDVFDAVIEGRGPQLLFTNTVFRLCDGYGEGSAEFDLLLRDGSAPYRADASVIQVDFARLLEQIGTDPKRTRGQLSGTLRLNADAAAGFWQSVQGKGTVEIEKGQLTDLPLLGGFSRLIQSTFPMFSLFSISMFYADFDLSGGAVRSENVELGGTLFSARARGNWSPDNGLDFILQAAPLRPPDTDRKWYQLDQQAAEALRWVTSPLFRFFEFRLDGQPADPRWRFTNLPKELSDLLQRPAVRRTEGGEQP